MSVQLKLLLAAVLLNAAAGALAADVIVDKAEPEHVQPRFFERIEGGAPLRGTYPPDAATLAAYEAWRADRGRDST